VSCYALPGLPPYCVDALVQVAVVLLSASNIRPLPRVMGAFI
jgi:hypothetical protein